MKTFWQDSRYGIRLLLSSPGLSAVAVFTLALGIAANTTVFSWIDGLLLRPYPGAAAGSQLAVLEMITAGAPNGANQVSYLDYCDYRERLKLVSGLALHREDVFSIGDAANGQAVWGELVSGNYFSVLGVKPSLGRVFSPDEYGDRPGAYPLAVISHRMWRTRFHGDPAVAGKTIRVNRRQLTIAGVAPPEFRGTMPGLAFDIWVPVTMGAELGMIGDSTFRYRGNRNLYALARLQPGIAIEQARAEAASLANQLASAFPNTNRNVTATVLPVWKSHTGAPELLLGPLQILMAISIIVLLIVCANVANLLLARSVTRRKEFSIRLALGAARARIVRQLLTETLILAAAGGAVALPLTFWMADLLPSLVPKIGVPVAIGFQLNARVFLFTILICGVAALVSGTAPSLFSLRADVNETLKEGGRSGSPGASAYRTRGLLVICEVALAAVALIGAGLFARSFENARAIHPGFDRNNVVLGRFYLASSGYSSDEVQQFCIRLRDRLRSAPGVTSVSYADYAPLGSSAGPYNGIDVEGYVPAPGESMEINRTLVAPDYFKVLKIPVKEGRDFSESDDRNTLPVVVVNETFAQRYFNGSNRAGRKIRCWGTWHTVVGVVRDSKYFNIEEAARPHFFAPFRQRYGSGLQSYFFIRTAGDPAPLLAGLRREVAAIDANAGFSAMPLREWTEVTLLPQKVAASLLAGLGLISLALAAVGLSSVMAYMVMQRTQEIGIRMALGACPGDVLRRVLVEGMALTFTGLAAGIAAAFAVTRLVASMLVKISAADPVTFAAASLFLAVVALLATYIPARRATRVDPMVALRCQ